MDEMIYTKKRLIAMKLNYYENNCNIKMPISYCPTFGNIDA
jgi:hypothetical protein